MTDFKFPVIAFSSSDIHLARNRKEIFVCTKTALNNKFYKSMKIVDSDGILYNIEGAKKIRGYGLFGGYNIFLNQKIEVELIIKSQLEIPLTDFKLLMINKLNKSFWDAGGNDELILDKINSLLSIPLIISYMTHLYYNE